MPASCCTGLAGGWAGWHGCWCTIREKLTSGSLIEPLLSCLHSCYKNFTVMQYMYDNNMKNLVFKK